MTTFTGTYLLANVAVEITSLYDEVQQLCASYKTDCEAELHIVTTKEQITAEGVESDENRKKEGLTEYHFPEPYLETLAVYRLLATQLLEKGILLMHGSAIAVDGEGYLFSALSGTGKSTHVSRWRQLFGNRAVMINDDKPLIKVADEAVIFGTPWDGKHHLSNNISVPLRAIVHLQRGEENRIEPVSPAEMLPTLIQQTFRPETAIGTMQMLELLNKLSKSVKFYSLHCNMQPDAARIAYEGMH